MRPTLVFSSRKVLRVLSVLVLAAGTARAQDAAPMSQVEVTVACSAPAALSKPAPDAPRIIGSQDTYARTLFGPHDLLVINRGLSSGIQLNQRFYVRRPNTFGTAYGHATLTSRTLGWIRIVAVDNSTAIAAVDQSCDGMMTNDYLEPFVAPSVPAEALSDADLNRGEPDFSVLSRVLAGKDDRVTAAPGDLVMIETGAGSTLTAGTRLAIYRDVRMPAVPLASLGEAVVVTVGETVALARIMRARDIVQTGDYMVVRK